MNVIARLRRSELFATTVSHRERLDGQSLRALAALVLLAQLPHVLHLPFGVSALGAAIVAMRLFDLYRPGKPLMQRLLSPLVLSAMAAATAIAIKLHFGYFLGRDPCVAFLFVLVAGKFAEVRRSSDTTLLLCLTAFLLLTQYFYSQSILSALVTLPAVVALGNALAVVRAPREAPATRERLQLVGKLLLQGLPIAALLFLVFPRLPGPLWSMPEDSMASTGLSDTMAPGSIGQLSQSPEVAFRVEFDGEVPPPAARYWRGPVLSEFDGRRWGTSDVQRIVPMRADSRLDDPRRLDYTVLLQPHRRHWLFALDAPVSLPLPSRRPGTRQPPLARLTDDGQLIAHDPVSDVLRYTQSSVPTDRFISRYPPPPETRALAGRNPRTAALAGTLRSQHPDDTDYAVAVLKRFRELEYRYTLSPQLLGSAPVDEFMFDSLEGFCEHYAAAFVVMMRAADIPARVITGYLGGEMNGDYMIVRQSDAHAWSEAWIDGAWQRFDPTAAVAPERVESGLYAALPDSRYVPRLARRDSGWLRSARLRLDALNHGWQRLVVDFDNESRDDLLERIGIPDPQLWHLIVAVLVFAGLWSLAVLRLPVWRRRRNTSAVEHTWQRFSSELSRRGVTRASDERPGDYITRAARALPKEAACIERTGRALIRLRFTRPEEETDSDSLNAIQREVRGLFLARLLRP